MADFRRVAWVRFTRKLQGRLLRAIVASAIIGATIYLLVMHVGLPAVAARLTDAQVARLRQTFAEHPTLVLGAIVGIAGVLGLPVLGIFRWIYGPLSSPTSRKQGA
jgi:uncharacterized membrane protein YedE/YeeE